MILILFIMSLTFTTSPTVAAGDPLRSRDLVKMGKAFNDRERAGFDISWRKCFMGYNLFRQVRNDDEEGNAPAEGEFFEYYMHLDPENGGLDWGDPAGDVGGANLASMMPAFIFGYGEVANEELRLGDDSGMELWNGINPPQTPSEFWELAKSQRGAIVPGTGDQNCPALTAAQSAQYLISGGFNVHGKTWGGWFPKPTKLAADCGPGPGPDFGQGIPSYEIFFTAKRVRVSIPVNIPRSGVMLTTNGDGESVIAYSGTCPFATPDSSAGHVQTINRSPSAFRVGSNDGSDNLIWDTLPTADWIEGPYAGSGTLYRYNASLISRAVFDFVNDFRGTAAQRNPDTFNIGDIAFDFESFRTRQYHLAPQRGFYFGAGLASDYPQATATIDQAGKIPEGTVLDFGAGTPRTSYDIHDGFVMTGVLAAGDNLFDSTSVEVLVDGNQVAVLMLTPDEPSALQYFATSYDSNIVVKMASDARFKGAGGILFECNEIAKYKPDHWDAYTLLRLSATVGGEEGEGSFVDGSGLDQTNSPIFFTNYSKNGCIVNQSAAGVRTAVNVNPNPVYDSVRRTLRDKMRIVQRRQFLTYEVTATKAILRFKRWVALTGGKDLKMDYFQGIAPGWQGVSELIEDETYVVRSHTGGGVVYRGIRYVHNKRFKANAKDLKFKADGDALLLEYEGIKPVARKKGWTNEWVCFFNFHGTHPSETSIWKADSYSDRLTWINRAHFEASADATFPLDLRYLITNVNTGNPSDLFSPEAPSSTNYYGEANATADQDFCKSNPIYPAPYEVESSTVEFDANGDDVLVLVFKTKFQSTDTAPSTRAQDYFTWDQAAIYGEAYRTDDNALCEYFLYERLNVFPSFKNGDMAANSRINFADDNPTGCIMPHMFMSRLERLPYEDGDDILQDYDSRAIVENLVSKEWWLKAGCESFINGFSSKENICDNLNLYPYDFLFEDLCLRAFGGTEIGDGHGPYPNSKLRAEHFNQISACVNLLTMVRVEGSMELQSRQSRYLTTLIVTPDCGAFSCIGDAGRAWWSGTPPAPAFEDQDDWPDYGHPTGSIEATSGAALDICLGLESSATSYEMRYKASAAFEFALSPIIKDLVDTNNTAVFGKLTHSTISPTISNPDVIPCDPSCPDTHLSFSDNPRTEDLGCQVIRTAGAFKAGKPPSGNFYVCRYDIGGGVFGNLPNSSSDSLSFYILEAPGRGILSIPLSDDENIKRIRGQLMGVVT